jgi:hypothetical protein
VVVFTTALFLSGYAIQQRTLRDLREAIKPDPRPKPQIFLPDRFKDTTTELPDGTVVVVDLGPGEDRYRPVRPEREQIVVEMTPTRADDGQIGEVGRRRDGRERLDDAVEVPLQSNSKTEEPSPPGGKERKKDDGDGSKKKGGKVKREKKISRAERRRLIKEEIQRLAKSNQPLIYQRRLW